MNTSAITDPIHFNLAASDLGWVLIVATPRGIVAIDLDDTPDSLLHQCAARFPNARSHNNDPDLARWADQLLDFIRSPRGVLALPLDIHGTPFQQRVWHALQQIPAGHTTTYSDLARQIGSPAAVRAVGRACAANPAAIVIPCHRVLSTTGRLTGYRWGLDRKKAILRRERHESNTYTVEMRQHRAS